MPPAPPGKAPAGHSTSAMALRPMLEYARRRGVDVPALLAQLGLPPKALDDADYRIPEAIRAEAWRAAARQLGDPAFGLRVAEASQLGAYDVLDYALYFSSTVREALDRLVRFRRIIGDSLSIEVAVRGGEASLRRSYPDSPPEEQDLIFAVIYLRLRRMSGRDLRPREVRFEHGPPADPSPWQELFHAPVRFGRPLSELVLEVKDLDLPTQTAEPNLVRVLDRHARDLLARLPANAGYADRVRQVVARALSGGPPTLQTTARALHASPRTVQRRLLEEGTTHRQVVDEVRRELAARYLGTPRLSITEIAFLLGFTEASGFRRTYRRWTGRSPARAR